MKLERGSGILLHITSLPGQYGIGDLGPAAYEFVDFLAMSGQKYWQLLPLGPVVGWFDNSPYMSLSAFAGNPLLISPDLLLADNWITAAQLQDSDDFSRYEVEFEKVAAFKEGLLESAYKVFQSKTNTDEFETFCRQAGTWLENYAIFAALRRKFNLQSWNKWPKSLAAYNAQAIGEARLELFEQVRYHKFVQYLFYSQWDRLHAYAREKEVTLVGDIPIYVAYDSADVWAHQDCFKLNPKTLLPSLVAGVPPDYFSETGQRWGNPVYRWTTQKKKINEPLYAWWQERFKAVFALVDIVRIDHFRGFEACWEIPEKEKDAVNGKWVKGPGRSFFMQMARRIGDMPIIAEDLGVITREVEKLRDDLGFPGMKILQFAFDSDENNLYLPHNFATTNCIVYSGTHDNDTSVGWYLDGDIPERSKERVRRYANSDGHEIHWDLMRLAFSSVAKIAIIPLQDVLGFGSDCRMNIPSTNKGNWRWRCAPEFLTDDISARLLDETRFYGRI